MGGIGFFQVILILVVALVIVGGPIALIVYFIVRANKKSDNRHQDPSEQGTEHSSGSN